MDIDVIRSRFIQDNLRRALQEPDRARAVRALRAFRNYFQWFENSLPDLEKSLITRQLSKLEQAYDHQTAEKELSDSDRIGHHLQETLLR